MLREELERLLDGEVEHVRDVLALEAHFERLAVVALAVALLARDVDVREEVHLDLDLAVALADLAAAALDVEGEAPRLVAARARLRACARRGRGSRRRGPCRSPGSSAACARSATGRRRSPCRAARGRGSPRCVPGRWRARCRRWAAALCRTSLTSVDLPEPETPVTQVNVPSGIETSMSRRLCSLAPRISMLAGRLAAALGHRDRAGAGEELAGERLGHRVRPPPRCPARRRSPPCSPAPGPRSTSWSAARIVCSSCSTTITVLPRSRRRSSVAISFAWSRWCSPIEGSSRM